MTFGFEYGIERDEGRPFEPCAIFYPDAGFTEVILADVAMVWIDDRLGYDMGTGELVAVRLPGDVTKCDWRDWQAKR